MSKSQTKENSYQVTVGNSTTIDFYSLPENTYAELIYGEIVMLATPSTQHQLIIANLVTDISNYIRNKNGNCKVFPSPFSVELDNKNVFEPDISVICDPSKLNEKGCKGAPDFVIEIVSPSTASHDYVRKLNAYLDCGVKEYWIIDPRRKKVYVYLFKDSPILADYDFKDDIPVDIYDGELSLKVIDK